MTGVLDELVQEYLAALIVALMKQDYDCLAEALLDLGVTNQRADRRALRADLEHLIAPHFGRPLGDLKLAPLLNEGFAIMRRHHLHLPPNLALLAKTILLADGLGLRLDPSFRLTTVMVPYADRLLLRQFAPARVFKRLGRAGLDLAKLGVEIPQQLRNILGEVERNGFEFSVRPVSFEPLLARLERLANRLVLGMLATAFIIGLAMLLAVYRPPGWERWGGLMFAAGFILAAGLGIYLALSILRPPRSKPD